MPSFPERTPAKHRTAGLILAAGASRRLGRPKQLLPYGRGVLLDAVLATARDCGFDQTVLALGGSAGEVQAAVNTTGCDIALNPDFGTGCSSSIAAGIAALHPGTDSVVLLLGDQPGVLAVNVRTLMDLLFTGEPLPSTPSNSAGAPGIAVCRYADGVGHPVAFTRRMLPELAGLHGDKAVWKLLEQKADDVVELTVPGTAPPDVDTDEDYRRALAVLEGAL